MMASAPTVSAVQMYDVFDGLLKEGLELAEIVHHTGLDPDAFKQVDGRLPVSTSIKLWNLLLETTGDPLCALKIGQIVRKQSMGVAANLFLSCGTLGEALDQSIRFHSLTNETGKIECIAGGKECLFRYSITDPRFDSPLVIERSLSSGVTWANFFTGRPIRPNAVFLQQSTPEYAADFRTFFDSPVHFGQEYNEIAFDASVLQYEGVHKNDYLKEILMVRASELHSRKKDSTAQVIADFLRQNLAFGEVSIESLCDRLGLSRTSLYRELKREGLSYQEVLDNVRKELVQIYLRDRDYSLLETAYLLGYSESSTFHRAFRRWFGLPPGQWKADAKSRTPDLTIGNTD